MSTTKESPKDRFAAEIERITEEYERAIAGEAGLDYMEELAGNWDVEECAALLEALEKRRFSRQAIGQFVLLMLEAAVGEGYVQPQLVIVKDILNGDGERDHQD